MINTGGVAWPCLHEVDCGWLYTNFSWDQDTTVFQQMRQHLHRQDNSRADHQGSTCWIVNCELAKLVVGRWATLGYYDSEPMDGENIGHIVLLVGNVCGMSVTTRHFLEVLSRHLNHVSDNVSTMLLTSTSNHLLTSQRCQSLTTFSWPLQTCLPADNSG
jgi:hypothetical protein